MQRRIFWNMMAVAAVAVLVAGLIGALLGQLFVAQEGRREMVRQAEVARVALAQQAAADGDRLLERLGELGAPDSAADEELNELIVATRRLLGNELFDVALVTRSGNVLLLSSLEPDPYGIDPDVVLAGEEQFVNQGEGRRLLVYARPLVSDQPSDLAARLALVVPRTTAVLSLATVIRAMLITLGLVSLLAVFAARYLSRSLAQRLDQLAGAASALAAGDSTVRAPVDGEDEVAQLSATFNDMADELEAGRRRETEFLMSVGHDLRTPLTTIAGYAEILEEGDIDGEEMDRISGVLAFETSRLRRLVEDIMLLARLEAREFTLQPESVDVAAHLGEFASAFARRAEQQRVRLEVDIRPTGFVVSDPDRLVQLAGNLLENALRYTPEAGRVALTVGRDGDTLTIAVSDTGPGIEPGDLPHVFDKLYVARRYRSARPEGSGLGLAIVKQLTDALGGSVTVTSAPGAGTTVTVLLPA